MRPTIYSFAVYPADPDGGRFDPFVLDVPGLSGRDAAARRAWWSVFHLLGPRGVEPEEYVVHVWTGSSDGELVTSAGIVPASPQEAA